MNLEKSHFWNIRHKIFSKFDEGIQYDTIGLNSTKTEEMAIELGKITMRNTIFLGGIHGVGKSTLGSDISNILSIEHLTASTLIQNDKNFNKKDKVPKDFYTESQSIVKEFQKKLSHHRIIFDAHFVLTDRYNNFIKIEEDIFVKLNLKSIIILVDNPKYIFERLKKRDNKSYDIEFLERFQKQEIEHSLKIATMLEIPHIIFDISKQGFEQTKLEIIKYIQSC